MLILLVIWTPRPTQRFVFWIGFAWILATTLVCRPDANGLGLRLSSLQSSLWITAGGLFFGGVIVGIALELRTLHPLHGAGSLELHMAGYLLWAFEQQFILQDYFLLRLLRILPNEFAAAITAAALFSTAHLPNLVLVVAQPSKPGSSKPQRPDDIHQCVGGCRRQQSVAITPCATVENPGNGRQHYVAPIEGQRLVEMGEPEDHGGY